MKQIHHSGSPVGNLATIDLNLLVAFDALARECSVTRAAHRLAVTQSAMSHTLRRLRALFDDPLLVRGHGGMVLTPRAEALIVPVRSGLVALSRVVAQPEAFEPATARRAYRVAAPNLFNALIIPALLGRIAREAPWVDVAFVPLDEDRLPRQLETGDIDVGVVAWMDEVGGGEARKASGLVRRVLFHDHFVTYLRADHPDLEPGPALSLATFTRLRHAMVSPSGEGDGIVDVTLRGLGLERRIALRIPDFYSALAIIARSDLVLTAPAALARLVPPDFDLVGLTPPLKIGCHSVNLIWHERYSADPGHRWLRDRVEEVTKASY